MDTDAYRILKLEQSMSHTQFMHDASCLDQIMRTSIWKKENNAYAVVFHQASRMSEKTQLKETENMYAPIRLVRLDETYRRQLMEMMQEWREYNTTPGVNRAPSAIFRNDETDFEGYIHHLEHHEASRSTIVRNGGIPENMVVSDDGGITERYWINLFS